jgi:hypothetical protein
VAIWPFSRRPPVVSEEDVLRDTAPEERLRYRQIDLANILSRIDRFSVSAVDTAWASIGDLRKKKPDLPADDPAIVARVEQSQLAIVNFVRHQLYDPALRHERTLAALDAQAAHWQSLVEGADETGAAIGAAALTSIAGRRSRVAAERLGG